MPFISGGGGGGGAFSGGTIHTPLDIAPTNPALSALTIEQPAGAVTAGTAWMTATNDASRIVFEGDSTGYLNAMVRDSALAFWYDALKIGAGYVQLQGSQGGVMIVTDDGAGFPLLVFGSYNWAPASASLAAGQFALWLDQTNGASKLMVKAKSADGTVVGAAIALA